MTKDSGQNPGSFLILMILVQMRPWKDPFRVAGLDFLRQRDEARGLPVGEVRNEH